MKWESLEKYGLLGQNIKFSLSPKIYNFWFKKYKLKASYEIIEVEENQLHISLFKELQLKGYKGLNITKPLKDKLFEEKIFNFPHNSRKSYLIEFSLQANLIKAVNTLILKENIILGYNTDYLGLQDSYKTYKLILKNKDILIIGASGAARALIYSLLPYNPNLFIYNRTPTKLEYTLEIFKNNFNENYAKDLHNVNAIKEVNDINLLKNIDIIFNATSVPLNNILDYGLTNQREKALILYSLNYFYPEEAKGLNTTTIYINGLLMLLYQASYNFEIWFGIKPKVNKEIIDYLTTNV
ncbi:Shikimate dehydrogenase [Candidatus Hepatincolaceae symbiont of Richtersius coronifer]